MRTDKRYIEDNQKEKLLKFKFVFAEKPKKGESAVKKKRVNCSFKMFLLLTVWYEEKKKPRGNHKNKNCRQDPQCVSVCVTVWTRLSQLKS